MAVSDGVITCIGKVDHVLLNCGGGQEGMETVQLKGQFVMPGFNDAHVHLGKAAADELAVPLTGVASVEEMQKRVAAAVAHHQEGEWITGGGWDHTLWPEKRFPNRRQLDAVAPRNPVILTHVSGHVAVGDRQKHAQSARRSDRTRWTWRADGNVERRCGNVSGESADSRALT